MTFVIAGADPALSNLGLVKGNLDLDTGSLSLTESLLIKTQASKNKTVVKRMDDLNRARTLYLGLHEFIKDVDIICVEMPVGSQTARAMCSYGVCIGVLASVEKPMIQVSAQEVKLAGAGIKNASKKQMIDWATGSYPNFNWLKQGDRFINDNEHLADALAAIYAGVRTDQFKQAKALRLS